MNKGRILILNYEFPPIGGGGGVAAKTLALGFIKNGFEVDYLTSNFNDFEKEENIDGINVYRVRAIGRNNIATANFISMVSYLFFGLLKGIKLCRENNYAFINTQFVIPTGPLGFILSKLFKLKNILSIHGGDIYDPSLKRSPHQHWYYRMIIKFLFKKADYVVAQSSNTKENALKYYGAEKNIEIIPLPYVSFDFKKKTKHELGLSENKIYLVSVGRLVKRKGYQYLLEALSLLKRQDICLLIIGSGPEEVFLKKKAEGLEVANQVKFLGNLTDEEKFQYLSNADIYVLSSLHEGFGIVLQEAMQVGLPIIATNNGGQTDYIKEDNGILVEPENAKELKVAVETLLVNESARYMMSRKNMEDVNKFDFSKISLDYIKLIDGKN